MDEPKFDLAFQRRAPEWSRSPEPSPHARGILVQPFNAATVCEFEPAPETDRVMQFGSDHGYPNKQAEDLMAPLDLTVPM